ncbi:DUF6932 family protein [Corynebacterium sp. NPDC060344]|uniref:DUF6932 family protein n=1 Tax=Corynebacterium sp. NPDC060344 TaxID=3347101 RepID=UPI00365DA49D
MTRSLSFVLQPDLTLPPGRFPMTFDEIETTWAFNGHRKVLLSEAQRYLEAVGKLTPIHAAWIGGSYLTNKDSPGDVDMSLLIDNEYYLARQQFLNARSLHILARSMNVRVDAYPIPRDHRRTNLTTPAEEKNLVGRGYWDDWWLRRRSIPPESYDLEPHPRRGYAEVNINGYS